MSKQAINHLESALMHMSAEWLIEYLQNREPAPKRKRESSLSPTKRQSHDVDWDWLKTKRFPSWAQKLKGDAPPKIAVFINLLNAERAYTVKEMEELLIQSGFDNTSWNWALGMLQTATTNHGYGHVLQRTGDLYSLCEELVEAHQRYFPASTSSSSHGKINQTTA